MKLSTFHIVIILFAFLHATTALVCRLLGLNDELVLTLFTMLMVAILCYRSHLSIEFTAVAIVLSNLAGYALGKGIASIVSWWECPVAEASVSSFVTTLILGYTLMYIFRNLKKNESEQRSQKDLVWIVMAVLMVFAARAVVMILGNRGLLNTVINSDFLVYFSSSVFALMFVLFVFIGGYVITARKQAGSEKEKRHLAQFRYLKLSQQVNPHFLFNSLNILDSLVEDGQHAQARNYIKKLAALYRYMLKNEEEKLVRLKDELEFVDQYADLLQVRFQSGFRLEKQIDSESLNKYVVPCSIQLLIENATKHNCISEKDPLVITIKSDDVHVQVGNNIRPKVGGVNSTGMGLKYISTQYKDLSGKDVLINVTNEQFIVELPLLFLSFANAKP